MGVLQKNNVLLCVFLWAEVPNAKDIHKEKFSVYLWKCLPHKAVHNCVPKVSLMKTLKRGAEVAKTTVKKTFMLRVSTHW
jgi:hypothetical protein